MEAEHFRTFGLRQPIAIVPNGVDTPPLQAFRPAADVSRRLLFLSRIHPKKGLPYLIRAWAALEPLYPNWELVIAGPDEAGHAREMLNLANSLKLQNIQWIGSVHGEEKKALYRGSDLFVLPTHAENFGLVVAEALAHGVPVVTTRNAPWAGLRDNRCGWWVELAHDSLFAALREAMALPAEERHFMGARGHAWMARDFGWDSIARQMLGVYRWVVGGSDQPECIEVG
jgi:glycosyltransferase involved in cell wall biosynthesis